MDFMNYILPELLVLIPVLYFLGYIMKKNSKVADENIPLYLCLAGMVLSFLYILSTQPLDSTQAVGTALFAAITQGILVAAVAVLGNQIVKQAEKAIPDDIDLNIETIVEEIKPVETTEVENDKSDGSLESMTDTHTLENKG